MLRGAILFASKRMLGIVPRLLTLLVARALCVGLRLNMRLKVKHQ